MSSTHRHLSSALSLMSLWPLEVDSARDHQNQLFLRCGDPTVTSPSSAPSTQFGILRSEMSFTHRQLSSALSLMSLWPLEVDSARDHQNQVFRPCGDPTVTSPPPMPLAPLNTKFGILRSKTSSTHHQLSSALSLMPLWPLEVDSARDHQNQVFRLCGDPAVTSPLCP